MLASAAISALVLPLQVGDRIGTDGSWVRNYPLGYAYERPEVELIVGFRYVPRYPVPRRRALCRRSSTGCAATRSFRPARTLVAELEEAVEREERGLPAHIADIFSRLSRVSIIRNTELEEVVADWRDQSVRELRSLREDVRALVADGGRPELAEAVDERFGERAVPVPARPRDPADHGRRRRRTALSLDPGFRNPKPWTEETKRELIALGWNAADAALREHGFA